MAAASDGWARSSDSRAAACALCVAKHETRQVGVQCRPCGSRACVLTVLVVLLSKAHRAGDRVRLCAVKDDLSTGNPQTLVVLLTGSHAGSRCADPRCCPTVRSRPCVTEPERRRQYRQSRIVAHSLQMPPAGFQGDNDVSGSRNEQRPPSKEVCARAAIHAHVKAHHSRPGAQAGAPA